MPSLPDGTPQTQLNGTPPKAKGGFANLKGALALGGLSGVGEGMMDKNFSRAYNAGKGSLGDLYSTVRMGNAFKNVGDNPNDIQKKLEELQKEAIASEARMKPTGGSNLIGGGQ